MSGLRLIKYSTQADVSYFLSYDNKINRNHRVFQFLNRDYSTNSTRDSNYVYEASRTLLLEYNSQHLPVSIEVQHGDSYTCYFTDVQLGAPYTITYENK